MKYYRVKVTTKEPYETRLRKDAPKNNGEIEWAGWAVDHGFAINTIKDALGMKGYSLATIVEVEHGDSETGPFTKMEGYPQKR